MLSMMPTGCSAWRRDIDVADATAVGDECIAAGAPPDTALVQPCDCTREEQVRAAQAECVQGIRQGAPADEQRRGPYQQPLRPV